LYSLIVLVVGLALLIAGGDLLVNGAVSLARSFGVSERLIGLTVVAIGTGAPETAATVIAAVRKETDLAMGNLIGSNIFNLLGILGAAALWRPLRFDSALMAHDGWWMLGSVVLLLPVILIGARDSVEGAAARAVHSLHHLPRPIRIAEYRSNHDADHWDSGPHQAFRRGARS
jgi:cation:H+ antiporter